MKQRLAACVVATVMAAGCASAFWFTGWRALAIQRVNLGDVRADVVRKLGKPDQIVSKTLMEDGRVREIWLYEAVRRPLNLTSKEKEELDQQVIHEQQYQMDRLHNPPTSLRSSMVM